MSRAAARERAAEGDEAAAGRRRSYVPLDDYAAIGDGRTVALVARDGTVDWLCLPDLDSPAAFAGLLDVERGGGFGLAPATPFTARRRYLPGTNVLETTFRAAEGVVRVTDAMTLPGGGLVPARELARRVEGLSGDVPMAWSVAPRFGFGLRRTRIGVRGGVPVASSGADALGVLAWDAGEARVERGAVRGGFRARAGQRSLIAAVAAHGEPLVLPARGEVEARLEATARRWRTWAEGRTYDGPWADAVLRSALVLKLLVHAPSGSIAAAATTSLPEEIGGERNWDYRYSWVRDSAFTLDALLGLGCAPEARAYLWWLMHASQLTHPRLHVLYRLDGGARAPERTLPLEGYRGSRPVRVGNGAAAQLQLDAYGELLQTAWLAAEAGTPLERDIGRRLAGLADLVAAQWRRPDSGIWEVRSAPRHFTQSKMMCWIALERAGQLAARGLVPRAHAARWRAEAAALRRFIEDRCWSDDRGSYVRAAESDDLDAGVLLGAVFGYAAGPGRLARTVEAVRGELARGPYVRRYTGEDGLAGGEGAFVACAFWLVEALARCGRVGEAGDLMEQALGLANDVGLLSEEVDPAGGAFLGNMPQGLSHLALVSAASALGAAEVR